MNLSELFLEFSKRLYEETLGVPVEIVVPQRTFDALLTEVSTRTGGSKDADALSFETGHGEVRIYPVGFR